MEDSKHFTHFIFLSNTGDSLAVAWQLQRQGHRVLVGIVDDIRNAEGKEKEDPDTKRRRTSMYKDILDVMPAEKLVNKMRSFPNKEKWFIFVDFNSMWSMAQEALKMGFTNGLFPSQFDYKLEADRDMGKQFIEKYYKGIEVAPHEDFKNIEEAIEYINESENFLALKGNDPSGETVVPKDKNIDFAKETLIDALTTHKEDYERKGFVLENQIRDGVEVNGETVSYNGETVFSSVDIENKEIGDENTAKYTGCMINTVVNTDPQSILNKICYPEAMQKVAKKHKGMFFADLNVIYKDGKFYYLENCFSDDTQILTKSGWKDYKDIVIGEETMSINPVNREIEWKRITRKVVLEHNGEMVQVGGDKNAIDALVTPDHDFWIATDGKTEMRKVKAKNLPKSTTQKIPRTGIWNGITPTEIILPEIIVSVPDRTVKKGVFVKEGGKIVKTINGDRNYAVVESFVKGFERHTLPEIRFETKAFAFILGLWIAEGSFNHSYKGEPRTIVISQTLNSKRRKEIEEGLKNFGLDYRVAKNGDYILSNRRLAHYFWKELDMKNCVASTKFIPQQFKEMGVEVLSELVRGFLCGDGGKNKTNWVGFTTSVQLADDLQEIIHKMGNVVNISTKKTKGTEMTIKGKTYTRNHDILALSIRTEKLNTSLKSSIVHKTQYNGIVWDVEVEDNHSMFVRRNGKAFFSSNCGNRPGYDSFVTEVEMSGGATEFFNNLVDGECPFKSKFGYAVRGLNLNQDKDNKTKEGLTMRWRDEDIDNIFPFEIQKHHAKMVSTGYGIDMVVFCASSDDLEYAINKAHDIKDNFSFKAMYTRGREDSLSKGYSTSILNRYDGICSNLEVENES